MPGRNYPKFFILDYYWGQAPEATRRFSSHARFWFPALLVLQLCLSCSPNQGSTSLSPSDYVAWVRDSGNEIRKSRAMRGVAFELQYKPIDYVIAVEAGTTSLSQTIIQKRRQELSGMHYFDLRLSPEKGGGNILDFDLSTEADRQGRLQYFSFRMKNDLFLERGGERIPCTLYHFERAFDMAPHCTFLLGFPASSGQPEDLTFVYDGPEFQTGPVKIAISASDISKIPSITTE